LRVPSVSKKRWRPTVFDDTVGEGFLQNAQAGEDFFA
jgi:hypothetical protein